MAKIHLLDCTLRDGGYLNDWEFGEKTLSNVFRRLVQSGLDFVEIGFLDNRRPADVGRSISPTPSELTKSFPAEKGSSAVVAMIDYGTCPLENIGHASNTLIDGIRVIFKKHNLEPAMAFCTGLKDLGYKVFAQLVSTTSYSDSDIAQAISLANSTHLYALSIIDTYGLMTPTEVLHYASLLDAGLSKEILLGFHGHNNLQLALANALAFMSMKTSRELIADGTICGMGKGAGNAPIELLASFANDSLGCNYRIGPLLEAGNESISPLKAKTPWGYSQTFFLASRNKCHPNYVRRFQRSGDLSATDIDLLLASIPKGDKKLLYNERLADNMLGEFLRNKYNYRQALLSLTQRLSDRSILLIGPGKNILLQESRVVEFVKQEEPIIISINFIPTVFKPDYVFCSKGNRYNEMASQIANGPNISVIATSNVCSNNKPFDYVFLRSLLIGDPEVFEDNSFLMLLRLLKMAGITHLTCAGFDGYSAKEANYARPEMEYDFAKSMAMTLNRRIAHLLKTEFASLQIRFITYSHYCDEEDGERGGDWI